MGTKRPLDSGRKSVTGATIRVSESAAEGRADAPPPPAVSGPVAALTAAYDAFDEQNAAVNAYARSDNFDYGQDGRLRGELADRGRWLNDARAAVIADPELVEEHHRAVVADVERLRAALAAAPLSARSDSDERAAYGRALTQLRDMYQRAEESTGWVADHQDGWGRLPDWATRHDVGNPHPYLDSMSAALMYARAGEHSPEHADTFDKALANCRAGRWDDGAGFPCPTCTKPLNDYDDQRYHCSFCSG